ncbi:MAG: MFS transporter [Acidimicrobiales bacterium]
MSVDTTTPRRASNEPLAESSSPFSSLAIQPYRVLWIAGLFSFLSVQGQLVLRGILAWDLTERDSALGVVYLCFGVSLLIATPLGGVAADRYTKRTILVACQVALFIVALTMGLLVVTDTIKFWMLPFASAAQGIAFGFFAPGRMAFTAELVGRGHLGNAISLGVLSMNSTRIVAPFAAGLLAGYATVGIGGTYLISAAISAIALVFLLRTPAIAPAATDADGNPRPLRGNPLVEIADSLRYVKAEPKLRRLVVVSFFVIMFGFNYVAFLPSLVMDTFGQNETFVGLAMMAAAIGAVATAIPTAKLADGPRAQGLMDVAGFLFGAAVLALAFAPNFVAAFGVLMVVGGATAMFQSLSNTLALTRATDAVQGRVQSLLMLSFAGFGIAAGPLGVLAELLGRRQAIAVMGVVVLISMAIYRVFELRGARKGETASTVTAVAPEPVSAAR